jgi:hypothetical protein
MLSAMDGCRWRVDVYLGRYGWVARAVWLCGRRKGRGSYQGKANGALLIPAQR